MLPASRFNADSFADFQAGFTRPSRVSILGHLARKYRDVDRAQSRLDFHSGSVDAISSPRRADKLIPIDPPIFAVGACSLLK